MLRSLKKTSIFNLQTLLKIPEFFLYLFLMKRKLKDENFIELVEGIVGKIKAYFTTIITIREDQRKRNVSLV